jgi:hypothetical protein
MTIIVKVILSFFIWAELLWMMVFRNIMKFFDKFLSALNKKDIGNVKRSSGFNSEMPGLSGFLKFCQINILLVVVITAVLFFTYGILLFHTSVGIDTELFLSSRDNMDRWLLSIGRFGLVFLQRLWSIKEFNPYTASFITLLFFELSAIAWCYLFTTFSKSEKRTIN